MSKDNEKATPLESTISKSAVAARRRLPEIRLVKSYMLLLGSKPWVIIPAVKIGIPVREMIVLVSHYTDIPFPSPEGLPVWTVEEAVYLQYITDERKIDAHEYKKRWGGTYLAGDEFKEARQELARLFK